uniref:Exoribonuclease 1 n=1 Tax=Hucho hucho TaxID=62062 RepID=A0A4W5Q222_9TELE
MIITTPECFIFHTILLIQIIPTTCLVRTRLENHEYKSVFLLSCNVDHNIGEPVPQASPTHGDFSDPVYKEIALANGHINRMNKDELRDKLAELKLDTRYVGTLVSVAKELCYTFQEYVRPEVNTQLSEFCVKLTGITQVRHQRVVLWLQEKELGTKYKYTLLTDGSWDMSKFMNTQCCLNRLRCPQFAKKIFPSPQVPRTQTKLSSMLEKLGLKYEGRPHSGLDDSRNIAHIAMCMLQDGCQLRINERMHEGQLRTVPGSAHVEGAPPPHTPRSRD